MEIKLRLRQIRESQNLDLKDVAEMAGISIGYLSQLETGKRQLNANRMTKLAEVLGCTPADLIEPALNTDAMRFSASYAALTAENKKAVTALIAALLEAQK